MSFSLIYICCSFRGGILSVVFPSVARCFWPAGNLECPCLFSDLILFPFLLFFFYCSLPFLFFYVFFIDLYLLWFPGRHSICKIVFFHSSTTPVVGGTLRWAWKSHFLIQYKKKLIISGDLFFCWNVLVYELQTSRVATPQRELRIWYIPSYMEEIQFLEELHT